jgi:ketosteroid isomerase-like protein
MEEVVHHGKKQTSIKEKAVDQQVKAFLETYAKANSSSDLSVIGSLYADAFMFAGPNGVRAVRKEDLLKVIPKMKAYFASIGLSETHLHSVEAAAVDSRYLLAKARWEMTVRDQNGDCRQLDAFATYVLERKDDDTLCIVLQIDHQDLATLIRTHQISQ